MSAFSKFARPYFKTEICLCFRVRVEGSNGHVIFYVVRYSYLAHFIRDFMKNVPGSYIVVLESLHYELPIHSFFVDEPF